MLLLEKIKLGMYELKNRMAMAPMTRSRADKNGLVGDLTSLYYSQRAGAGLLISEAVNISEQAIGSPYTSGLYTRDQILAWKKVTDAVHKANGIIFAQLWHTGRVAHSIDKNGELPVAPSAIPITSQQHFTSQGLKDYEIPRALTSSEIKAVILDYKQAAINSLEAGFDGVELHSSFGYLPNQFLAESSNQRTDEFGGSIENRCRFVLEVMTELVKVQGENKAGIKLSPSIPYNSMLDGNPTELYTYLIKELDKLPLAYIHFMNALYPLDKFPHYPKDVLGTFGSLTKHIVIGNGGYSAVTGEQELEKGIAKIISYGTLFLANPDLPRRFELNAPLNQVDRATMYGGGAKGYTDYPKLIDY